MRPITTPRELGAVLRQARTDAGLTQAVLAERAGVSRPWLSELEGGKRTAEIGKTLAVANALGLAFTVAPTPRSGVDLDDLVS